MDIRCVRSDSHGYAPLERDIKIRNLLNLNGGAAHDAVASLECIRSMNGPLHTLREDIKIRGVVHFPRQSIPAIRDDGRADNDIRK